MERHSFERVPKVIEAFVKDRDRHTANALKKFLPASIPESGFPDRARPDKNSRNRLLLKPSNLR